MGVEVSHGYSRCREVGEVMNELLVRGCSTGVIEHCHCEPFSPQAYPLRCDLQFRCATEGGGVVCV